MTTWTEIIQIEQSKEYFKRLQQFLDKERTEQTVFPKTEDVYRAFELSPLEQTKVVILGMDPYINSGEAHGLSFSVPLGIKIPPSLKNIFKELKDDLNIEIPSHGCLESWAKQGILLLNSILTVRQGTSNSHDGVGWQTFTDAVISTVNNKDTPVVFILWGAHAKKKKYLITNSLHKVIEGTHPSPLAVRYGGFFGSKPFSQTNNFLIQNNLTPIDWTLT